MCMLSDPSTKYKPYTPMVLPGRQWPSGRIVSPTWLSTDLRDGNQALATPMTIQQKLRLFRLLVKCGFKEIEVGYPAASETEFEFVRLLIEKKEIPDDVWIQVLTPAREDLMRCTVQALAGAKKAIFHMYNAISPTFREVVFQNTKQQTLDLVSKHAKLARILTEGATATWGTQFRFQYTPEAFNQTETDFSLEVCEAVKAAWGKAGSGDERITFNLPATVEVAPPNHYADQIEHFCRHISERSKIIVSLHPHNDRGTAVAATEFALMAGADRVEGCIFGNGERTGNVDLVTLAMNQYSQGMNPGLDFSDIREAVGIVQECNAIPVHPRHPYAGELAFSTFAASHQDAVTIGLAARRDRHSLVGDTSKAPWNVPFLTMDPADIGQGYDKLLGINSLSGEASTAHVILQQLSFELPRRLRASFHRAAIAVIKREGRKFGPQEIVDLFRRSYFLDQYSLAGRFSLESCILHAVSKQTSQSLKDADSVSFQAVVSVDGNPSEIRGMGHNLAAALLHSLYLLIGFELEVVEVVERSFLREGTERIAVFVEVRPSFDEGLSASWWGVGIQENRQEAVMRAVISAVNSAVGERTLAVSSPCIPA